MRAQLLMVAPLCLSGISERNIVHKVIWLTDLIANSFAKHDGKCTYNVTLRRAPAPMLQWNNHKDLHILSVCL